MNIILTGFTNKMVTGRKIHLFVLLVALLLIGASYVSSQPQDMVLCFYSECKDKDLDEYYIYHRIFIGNYKVKAGDCLEYDIFISSSNPDNKAGVDILFSSGNLNLRDSNTDDTEGINSHPGSGLPCAVGKWHHRKIHLDKFEDLSIITVELAEESNQPGRYITCYDNIVVTNNAMITKKIYITNNPQTNAPTISNYSNSLAFPIFKETLETDGVSKILSIIDKRIDLTIQKNRFKEETSVLQRFLEVGTENQNLLKTFVDTVAAIDDKLLMSNKVDAYELQLNDAIKAFELIFPYETIETIKKFNQYFVGHAHIDFQWLWTWGETVNICRDTFNQALKFMDEYPDFCFTQSMAGLYKATEENFPELFRKIKKYVKDGRWEIVGGNWTEGDTNLVDSESRVRQYLYGQLYFKKKFGKLCTVGWEPDTFGHSYTMPQVLIKSGLKYYYFTRSGPDLFPEALFYWQGLDGSKILTYCGSKIVGGDYFGDVSIENLSACAITQSEYGLPAAMAVYGVGNHGGGPTRESIKLVKYIKGRPYLPDVEFSTAEQYFNLVETVPDLNLPIWNNEMNPVFPGCYTARAEVKKITRNSEIKAVTTEKVATFATLFNYRYPTEELRALWEDICWGHHHDTIGGTTIASSFELNKQKFNNLCVKTDSIKDSAISLIISRIRTRQDGIPILVLNMLGWERDDYIELEIESDKIDMEKSIVVVDSQNQQYICDIIQKKNEKTRIGFIARGIPSLGFKTFYIKQFTGKELDRDIRVLDNGFTIENKFYRIIFDPETGCITSIFDKQTQKELIEHGRKANLYQLLFEKPHPMSAWEIGSIDKIIDLCEMENFQIVESNAVKVTVEITRKYNESFFKQKITIYSGIDRIDFPCSVDWQEKGTDTTDAPMLKVAFPLTISSSKATYDIPFGHIERSTGISEFPGIKWIDYSTTEYGVSLLNNCKYGHDVVGNVMRLTLLRSSYWPDPEPDKGKYEFTYALYSHSGTWREAKTIKRSYELNNPLLGYIVPQKIKIEGKTMDDKHSFVSINPDDNLVITSVKKSEDGKAVIIRFYETKGKETTAVLKCDFHVEKAYDTDLLEGLIYKNPLKLNKMNNTVSILTKPYEIKTLRIE